MIALLKNNRKFKISDTKDVDFLLFSRCKYIKTETRNRLIPQTLKLLDLRKVFENFGNIHKN